MAETVRLIPDNCGKHITPSYVAFRDNTGLLVGTKALNSATIAPAQTVFNAKRLMGKKFNNRRVQEDGKLVPFKLVSDERKNPQVQV